MINRDFLSISGVYSIVDGAPVFNRAGVSISGSFRGDSLSLEILNGSAYFVLFLNGKRMERRLLSPGINRLFKGGVNSEENNFLIVLSHEVESDIVLGDFKGELLPFHDNRDEILFIGDSLTVGYGNLSPGIKWDRDDSYEFYTDITKGYSWKYAAKLGLRPVITAYSGKGVYKNYNNDSPGINIPYLFKEWNVDVNPKKIVINLGTNDFSNDIDFTLWQEKYIEFLTYLKNLFTDAEITVISPNGIGLKILNSIKNELNVNLYSYRVSYSGLDSHPNVNEHREIFSGLMEEIHG